MMTEQRWQELNLDDFPTGEYILVCEYKTFGTMPTYIAGLAQLSGSEPTIATPLGRYYLNPDYLYHFQTLAK